MNNVLIRLAALVAALGHPGTASAQGMLALYCNSPNHGLVPIAASAAPV